MTEQTLLGWLWLAQALGPAPGRVQDILRTFPDPEQLLARLDEPGVGALFTRGQWSALRRTRPAELAPRLEQCRSLGVGITVYGAPDYPAALRQLPDAPLALYYRGDLSAVAAPLPLAVIGARTPSSYGRKAAQALAGELAQGGAVIVSGLAYGLDSAAHEAALEAGMPTVACLAFGHGRCYPASHGALKARIEETGLTLSEYPPQETPRKDFFLQRNRLIAGLSRGVLVVEAKARSGTMNTVSHAVEYGRDVFAVPGSIFSELSAGTNELLCQGAHAVRCAADVFSFYGLELPPAPPPSAPPPATGQPLSAGARQVLAALGPAPLGAAEVCAATGLAFPTVLAAFTELEMAGSVLPAPGRRYVLK